jgi:bifunctional ADP-heptose synthase (sugar kinase/adenylyltransferase)
MLANLKQVDYVYIFNDETPARPVDVLKPDIVLK